jgi:hypothetical protein
MTSWKWWVVEKGEGRREKGEWRVESGVRSKGEV